MLWLYFLISILDTTIIDVYIIQNTSKNAKI